MTLRNEKSISLALAALLLLAGTQAGAAAIDYVGFGWETDGLAASNPGDELAIATVVTQIDPLFEVDLDGVEGTLFIDGLVSTGSTRDEPNSRTIISYVGGSLRVHADASRNHDWGLNPANGTVPSTFVDGELVFSGDFTTFTVILNDDGTGIFEGLVDGTGGSALAGPCADCAYTFAGTFAAPTGAQIPAGYDIQVDGQLAVESTVAVESMNWGSVKQLYNTGR